MFKINLKREPVWIDALGGGFLMAPVSHAGLAAGRAAAAEVRAEAGESDELSPETARAAGNAMSRGMILEGMVDWRDMVDSETGEPVPLTRAALEAALEDPILFELLEVEYVLPYWARLTEKNGSSSSPNGIGAGAMPAMDIASRSAKKSAGGAAKAASIA